VAALSFREHGGDTSGIGTVMKKAGLTKGGFYRHFGSKDDLLVEAVARAFDEMGTGMLAVAKAAPEGEALRAIIEYYLSPPHANSPGKGCLVAALGPELAQKPLSVRKRIEASQEAYRERLLPFVPGQTREEKLAKFWVVFARRWQRRHLAGRREDRGRGTSPDGNAAAREGTIDGSRIHSRRTLDAAEGIDAPRSAAVTLLAIAPAGLYEECGRWNSHTGL
jgi:TetR/AcrR family transcriptional repressor of nem operon